MKTSALKVSLTAAAFAVLSAQPIHADDQELKIGVVAAESGSFVSGR
jgi:hypothetical protein